MNQTATGCLDFPPFEPSTANPKEFVFVSFAQEDIPKIGEDLYQLNQLGYRLWYDRGSGDGICCQLISERLEQSSVFLVFVSQQALMSGTVTALWQLATIKYQLWKPDSGKTNTPIIAVILDEQEVEPDETLFDAIPECLKVRSGPDYLDYLSEKLAQIAPGTRESAIDADSEILGIGNLPTFRDILEGRELSDEERERRRCAFVTQTSRLAETHRQYQLDNVFQLTSEAIDNLVALPATMSISSDVPSNLLRYPLKVRETFVAPLRLVAGLITRLDENWPPLVSSFSSLVKQNQANKLDDLHYFIEFCWLAWGPSVSTQTLIDEKGKFVLLQAAFGDEANSLHLILKREKWMLEKESLPKLGQNGCRVELENVIVVKPGVDPFFRDLCEHPLFQDLVADDAARARVIGLYLPFQDEGIVDGSIRGADGPEDEGACYSTAYVWLMIEQTFPGRKRGRVIPLHESMRPGFVIPFFEHANLATDKGLDFLQHCLARKAIYHILQCAEESDYKDQGYYRFATALFPHEMVRILRQEISRLSWGQQGILKKRLYISDPVEWRRPEEVVAFANDIDKAIMEKLEESLVVRPNFAREIPDS
jgi:hypothetical protein